MPPVSILEESSAKIKTATDLFTQYKKGGAGAINGLTPAAKLELEKAARLFLEARDLKQATIANPTPNAVSERLEAPMALVAAAEVFVHLAQFSRAKEHLDRAKAELETLLSKSPDDLKLKENLAHCSRVLDETNRLEAAQTKLAITAETAGNPSAKIDLKLRDDVKGELRLIEEARQKAAAKKSFNLGLGSLLVVTCVISVAFYGAASGRPHEVLASGGFLGSFSGKILPHSVLGSLIPVVLLAVGGLLWKRKYPVTAKNSGVFVVASVPILVAGFYLGDVIYHLMR
jgi:hypothetical protein